MRSGILNSVHAFANDPARGVFILGLLGLVIGGSLLLFALRAPVLAAAGIFAPISREGALVLNNILLCSIAAVVITGTMYPLFADLLLGEKISASARRSSTPPCCRWRCRCSRRWRSAPMLSWKRARPRRGADEAVVGGAASLPSIGLSHGDARGAAARRSAFAAAVWVILGALADLGERVRLFRVPLAASLDAALRGLRARSLRHRDRACRHGRD